MKARIAFALARGSSICIRGQREKWGHVQRETERVVENEVQNGHVHIVEDAAEARAAIE